MAWINVDTVDNVFSSSRLNSSKQPHAPLFANPVKMRPIDLTSKPYKYQPKDIHNSSQRKNNCYLYVTNMHTEHNIGWLDSFREKQLKPSIDHSEENVAEIGLRS